MLNLILSIFFSAGLLFIMRLFPRWEVRSFQAIAFNYAACVVTGLFFLPEFTTAPLADWWPYALCLGGCFMTTFFLTSLAVRTNGLTVGSLASNLSLLIPVGFSLFTLGWAALHPVQYIGLAFGLAAVVFSAIQSENSPNKAGFFLPIIVFLFAGGCNTFTQYINGRFQPDGAYFTTVTFLSAAGLALTILTSRIFLKYEIFHLPSLVMGGILGFCNYLSYLFLVKALADFHQNGALLFPLYNVGTILVSAGAAVFFFREKLSRFNQIGLVLAVLAIVLLLLK